MSFVRSLGLVMGPDFSHSCSGHLELTHRHGTPVLVLSAGEAPEQEALRAGIGSVVPPFINHLPTVRSRKFFLFMNTDALLSRIPGLWWTYFYF